MSRAKYCKCKNTYTINNCQCEDQFYYWSQGIGSLVGQNGVIPEFYLLQEDGSFLLQENGDKIIL